MFTSIRNLPSSALPMLSAMLFLSLTGTPPAAAATVVSTAHYQASLALTCNGGQLCRGDFPGIVGRRRLQLTRVTCHMHSAQYAVFASGKIELRAVATGVISPGQFLPADYSTEWGYHVLNSAVALQVAGGNQFSISLFLVPGSGVAYDAACTAHGTLETLQ